MSDEWYSTQPRSRFSKEHRELLPKAAKMIDLDQVLWLPYDGLGEPLAVCELKPEVAREDFWTVTRNLAQRAQLPAIKVIERSSGTYRVFVASDKTNYEPYLVGHDLSMKDFYTRVELPLREKRDR